MRCNPSVWPEPLMFRRVYDEVCWLFRLRDKMRYADDYNKLLDESPSTVAKVFRLQMTNCEPPKQEVDET